MTEPASKIKGGGIGIERVRSGDRVLGILTNIKTNKVRVVREKRRGFLSNLFRRLLER